MKNLFIIAMIVASANAIIAQSFEVMPGTERLFIDAQFLKFFDGQNRLSLFSRARATTVYKENSTDLFTGAYLNYTAPYGFGGTLIGRIATNGSGIDIGPHFFKASSNFVIYALPSINVGTELLYSWFSIVRYRPPLHKNWRLYLGLELFSAFGSVGHLTSTQRIRIGADKDGFQFGFAVNLNEPRSSEIVINPGVFARKEF